MNETGNLFYNQANRRKPTESELNSSLCTFYTCVFVTVSAKMSPVVKVTF